MGDIIYAFVPLKLSQTKKRDNYQGVVRGVDGDGVHFEVEMMSTKSVQRVHSECMFRPGSERIFEIVRANMFECAHTFRADIILLPFSISNDSFRSLLLTGCKRCPISYVIFC